MLTYFCKNPFGFQPSLPIIILCLSVTLDGTKSDKEIRKVSKRCLQRTAGKVLKMSLGQYWNQKWVIKAHLSGWPASDSGFWWPHCSYTSVFPPPAALPVSPSPTQTCLQTATFSKVLKHWGYQEGWMFEKQNWKKTNITMVLSKQWYHESHIYFYTILKIF